MVPASTEACLSEATLQRVSVTSAGGQGNDSSYNPSVSSNGSTITWSSHASTLVPGDTNAALDVFTRDAAGTGAIERSSLTADGSQPNDGSAGPAISGDGNVVSYYSHATNMLGGDTNTAADFFGQGFAYMPYGMLSASTTTTVELWFKTTSPGDIGPILGYTNVAQGQSPTQAVPVLYIDTQGRLRGSFWNGAVDPLRSTAVVNDGLWHHVVLTTFQGIYQFLHVDGIYEDFRTGQVNHADMHFATIGSAFMTGWPGAGSTGWQHFRGTIDEVSVKWGFLDVPQVSAHYNARSSNYRQAVLADSPAAYWRMSDPSSTSVMADTTGNGLVGAYSAGGISRQEPGALTVDFNDADDVFVRDRQAAATERVSVSSDGEQANRASQFPAVDGSGRHIGFLSDASNLVPGDTNNRSDVFVRDRQGGQTTRVSTSSTGAQANNGSLGMSLSEDGRYVAFESFATNLVAADTNGRSDIFVKDRQTGQTTRVSTSSTGAQANNDSLFPHISADGRYVTFYSWASNLVAGDTNGTADAFVKDTQTGTIERVSVSTTGVQGNQFSGYPSVSDDGRYVAYYSGATNLVPGDTNGVDDVLLRDRLLGTTTRISTSSTGGQSNGYSSVWDNGAISGDGARIVFDSSATNLVSGDSNGETDVFLADQGAPPINEFGRFVDLWLPRLTDQPFIDDLLNQIGYPVQIILEGFHGLGEAAQRQLSGCLAVEYVEGLDMPAEFVEEALDYASDAIHRLIFDKDSLGGDERSFTELLEGDPLGLGELIGQLLAPLPVGPLDNLLAPGSLSALPLLGGGLLFDGDPVEGIGDTLGAFAPPVPPVPALEDTLDGLAGAINELGVAPVLFQLLGSATYDLRVERFSATGTKLGDFTETAFLPCTPTTLSSVDGRLALPTTHDLRVNLCPDPLSLLGAADQRLSVVADALQPGTRVRLTYTLNTLLAGLNGQLQVIVDASDRDLPVELGTGSTAPFPCNQNTLPPVLPLLTPETRQGFCAELTANGADPTDGTNTIRTFASSPVPGVTVRLSDLDGSETTPVGELEIREVPAADGHAVTLTAQQPAPSNGDELAARVQVTNAEPGVENPGEEILVRQYDDQGMLAAALTVSDVPTHFDATLTAPLDVTGQPEAVTLEGTGDASADAVYRLEQFEPTSARTALLEIRSFATEFDYAAQIIHDDQLDADVGLTLTGTFPEGAPSDGELYLEDTIRGAELLVRDFSLATEFTAVVDDPADPHQFTLGLANAEHRPEQVIRVVQSPSGGPPVRLLLAGTSADPGEFVDPAEGRALRWTSIPQSFDLDVTLVEQPTGDPASVTFNITSSDAPVDGAIKLRDHGESETIAMTVVAPSTDQTVSVALEGTLADPSSVRIERDNGVAQAAHALQIAVLDAAGVRAQVTFVGAAANTSQLIPGSGRDIDAVATNVGSTSFSYQLDIEGQAGATPAAATISGTTFPTGASMDVLLTDFRSDLRLHQRGLPTQFTYALRTNTDGTTGQIAGATIEALQQSSAVSNGLLELSFGDLDAVFEGFAQSFTYSFTVDGPTDNPTGFTADIQQAPGDADILVQLAKGVAGGSADFALTLRDASRSPILPEVGSNADMLMVGVPQHLQLALELVEPGADHTAAEVQVDTFGADLPGATMRVRRSLGGQRQELRLLGIAPELLISLGVEGDLNAPDAANIDVYRTVAHPTDVVQLLVYDAGALAQNVRLGSATLPPGTPGGSNEPGPVGVTGESTDVALDTLPEGLHLRQTGGRSPQGQELLGLVIMTSEVGAALGDPRTPIRTGAQINAVLRNQAGLDSRRLRLADLPAEVNVDYVGPLPHPSIEDSCLGDIGYSASDSLLDLRLEQHMGPIYDDNGVKLGDGCYPDTGRNATAGELILDITDMPSLGFEEAAVYRDGQAVFRTHDTGSGRQVVGRVDASVPVPDWVAGFANRELDIDTTVCPEDVACNKINIEANPHFVNMRLIVRAPALSDVEVRTNVGPNGDPKPDPPGDDVDALIWSLVPILGVRNNSPGAVTVQLQADEDSTETNEMHVHVGCCMGRWSTANHDLDVPLDAYPQLQTSFYGWEARELLAPFGGVAKFNRQDEEIENSFGNKVRSRLPFMGDEPVPFGTRFIEYHPALNEQDLFDRVENNYFEARSGAVSYFLPNLFNVFAATPSDIDGDGEPDFSPENLSRELWYARAALYQSNWYWYGMLHELEPDLHGFFS